LPYNEQDEDDDSSLLNLSEQNELQNIFSRKPKKYKSTMWPYFDEETKGNPGLL
ncbi:15636_t:CDS:1, partial [Racocetra persica]